VNLKVKTPDGFIHSRPGLFGKTWVKGETIDDIRNISHHMTAHKTQ